MKNPGIIYELDENRFGLAINAEQAPAFKDFGRVFLHVYTDRLCTIPERDPKSGKSYVTLKHKSKIKAIGFSD